MHADEKNALDPSICDCALLSSQGCLLLFYMHDPAVKP